MVFAPEIHVVSAPEIHVVSAPKTLVVSATKTLVAASHVSVTKVIHQLCDVSTRLGNASLCASPLFVRADGSHLV